MGTTYAWTAQVHTGHGPDTQVDTWSGQASGPPGFTSEQAKEQAREWLRSRGVRGAVFVTVKQDR